MLLIPLFPTPITACVGISRGAWCLEEHIGTVLSLLFLGGLISLVSTMMNSASIHQGHPDAILAIYPGFCGLITLVLGIGLGNLLDLNPATPFSSQMEDFSGLVALSCLWNYGFNEKIRYTERGNYSVIPHRWIFSLLIEGPLSIGVMFSALFFFGKTTELETLAMVMIAVVVTLMSLVAQEFVRRASNC